MMNNTMNPNNSNLNPQDESCRLAQVSSEEVYYEEPDYMGEWEAQMVYGDAN
jgi:hypothetical protein